jgi:hypothetical protein
VSAGKAWYAPVEDREPLDTFDAALDAVIFRTLALTSAIAKLDYWDAARLRVDAARALARAEELAALLPEVPERPAALHRVRRMREVALLLLAIAPTPSAAALERAQLGDLTVWDREELAWITSRMASGPRSYLPRWEDRDTQPDTPSIPALARERSPNKAGAQ